jgi:hypothetical protein
LQAQKPRRGHTDSFLAKACPARPRYPTEMLRSGAILSPPEPLEFLVAHYIRIGAQKFIVPLLAKVEPS